MIEIIDTVIDKKLLEKTAKHFAQKKIILPTFEQLKNPQTIPNNIKDQLKNSAND